MRKYLIILFLLFTGSAFANTLESQTRAELQSSLDSGEYFVFHEKFVAAEHQLTPEDWLYFSAWDQSCFGNAVYSNALIDSFLVKDVSDSVKTWMLMLRMQNSFRLFRYQEVADACEKLQGEYAPFVDPAQKTDIANLAGIANGLKDVPAQTVERNGDLDLKFKRDLAQLIRIPVSVNQVSGNFIVDTGANLSTISESEAKRMKVQLINTSFGVVSSSRASVGAKLGVADELVIGNAVFHHVVFIVLPDNDLRFLGGLYKIKGIVGLPVLAQLGEIQITDKNHFISPMVQSGSDIRNLGFSGNTMFVNASFYGTAHPYIFDTGAAAGIMNSRFLKNYKDSIGTADTKTSHVGGAGGMQSVQVVSFRNAHYSIGNKSGVLKRSMIQVDQTNSALESFYGIVGEDIFTQWKTMTINFQKGFVVFT